MTLKEFKDKYEIDIDEEDEVEVRNEVLDWIFYQTPKKLEVEMKGMKQFFKDLKRIEEEKPKNENNFWKSELLQETKFDLIEQLDTLLHINEGLRELRFSAITITILGGIWNGLWDILNNILPDEKKCESEVTRRLFLDDWKKKN